MKRINFIWIDDDPERGDNARSMQDNLDLRVDFINIKGEDAKSILEKVRNRFKQKEPDLVLMDHRLDKLADGHLTAGSSLAEFIREISPACPVVAITAVDIKRDIDFKKRSAYEDVFEIQDISDKYDTLISIVQGYKSLKGKPPHNVEALLTLIQVPEDDKRRLLNILPADLRTEFDDNSLPQRISQWVRHVLMGNPGFLYDNLWTATLLGIKVEKLEKIRNIFLKAEYKGIFCDNTNPRWWPTLVKNMLYKKFPKQQYTPPEKLAQELEMVKPKDISICYVCGEPYPETVAFVDDSRSERKPMHLRCTDSDPKSPKMLFFEEIRVMKAAD